MVGATGPTGVIGATGETGADGQPCTVTAFDGGVTVSCPGSSPVTVLNGTDASTVVDFATLGAAELEALDFSITVSAVTDAARPVAIFKVTDQKGRGVKNITPANFSGIALLKLVPGSKADGGGNGLGNDTWVSYVANCPTCTSSSETASASSLQDNGDGVYTYTFTKDVQSAYAGTTYSADAVTRFAMRLVASGNPFRPLNVVYDYIPSSGANVTGANEKVATNNCLDCHNQFRANALNKGGAMAFHSGQRYLVPYCFVCHNDQRKYVGNAAVGNSVIAEPTIDGSGNMTPPTGQTSVKVVRGQAVIDLPVWIHKIHRGEELYLKGKYAGGSFGEEINHIAYPQDIRNCDKCHRNATLADNWKTKPSRRACGACHDNVDFAAGTNHTTGGPQLDDDNCTLCHTAAAISAKHTPVASPAPNNIFLQPDGGSANTNAAYVANPASPPAGASVIGYVIPDAGVATVASADGGLNATVKFKMVKDGADVVFNAYDGGSSAEMVDNFVGAASAYCAFALPQDGITAPADFNATAYGYLKNLWKGTTSGANAGTLSGPVGGYYTATLTGVNIPASATMLTCGIGYTYSLSSTLPLTQTNVAGYPYTASSKTGGLIVPAPNVWRVANGYTGRRGATSSTVATGQIVGGAKCNSCHGPIGVSPTFHGGQRNDGATCAFCHNPNRTRSGWAVNSSAFVHALHAAGKRTEPFSWYASSATKGFWEIKFPGRLQMCESCHTPGYYDYSASWYTSSGGANLAKRPPVTVATGKYDGDAGTNPSGSSAYYTIAPYVAGDATTNYGSGLTFNVEDGGTATSIGAGWTGTTNEPASTTLVSSPMASVCFSCHDSPLAALHMQSNGGALYQTRSSFVANTEQCLLCHGPGKVAAIKEVHYQ